MISRAAEIVPDTVGSVTNYVGGRFVTSTRVFPAIDPVDGTVHGEVHEADRETVDAAVQAARAALKGQWSKTSFDERRQLLHRVAEIMARRSEEFLRAEIADTGKPQKLARAIDIPRGAANFRAFAELVQSQPTECYEQATHDGAGAVNYAVRRPVGVVAVICPWNLPLLLMTWKVAPALACGNTVVAKPSEETPCTAFLLAEVMHEAGVPAGVFNVVNGYGEGSVGEWLSTHPDINAITFTGESATGSRIMRAAADNVKRISFELGGKNAALIFADADFDKAVAGTALSTFMNTGQVCLCTERIYVQRPIFDDFVEAMRTQARKLVLGRPYDEATTTGPLISAQHRCKVMSCYALAREEGAEIVSGGGIPEFGDSRDGGFFIEPTVLTGLRNDARSLQEEVFGPVCHIMPFDEEEEAVQLANDSRYGLAATVWTRDLARAHRAGRAVEAGVVWVNTWFLRDLRTPFGGMKLSGVGREGGRHSLDFFTEQSNLCIKL